MLLALVAALGMLLGAQLAVAQCQDCIECFFVDGFPLGKQLTHSCSYNDSCYCSGGVGIGGWCRVDTCKMCNGSSASAGQCQSEMTCMDDRPATSLCLDACP